MATEDRPYGKIYREMCKDKRITHVDRTIYAFIQSHANWRVVQSYIASELDIGISTVQRSINRLDSAGYLSYDVKETEQKRERRNMKMLDQPQVRNEPFKNEQFKNERCTDEQVKNELHTVQNWVVDRSKMNGVPFKNERSDRSKMNYNEAINEDSLTEASLTKKTEIDKPDLQCNPGETVEQAEDRRKAEAEEYKEMINRTLKFDFSKPSRPLSQIKGIYRPAGLR
jgi:hypothetical protein